MILGEWLVTQPAVTNLWKLLGIQSQSGPEKFFFFCQWPDTKYEALEKKKKEEEEEEEVGRRPKQTFL